jgi:hypothetical protein
MARRPRGSLPSNSATRARSASVGVGDVGDGAIAVAYHRAAFDPEVAQAYGPAHQVPTDLTIWVG